MKFVRKISIISLLVGCLVFLFACQSSQNSGTLTENTTFSSDTAAFSSDITSIPTSSTTSKIISSTIVTSLLPSEESTTGQLPYIRSTIVTSLQPSEESTTGKHPYYSVNKYGIQLSVKFDKSVFQHGENLSVTAIVKNNENSAIQYTLPSSTENMHNEIIVKITDSSSGMEFIDADTFGRVQTADLKTVTLKSGESFSEVITFVSGYRIGGSWKILKDADIKYFEAGEYTGSAQFRWNREDGDSTVLEYLKLNFRIIIQ